jgi:hypothetical protein
MHQHNSLDLHGVRHHEVDALVENFVLTNQNSFPLTVVCGNSVKMVQLAEQVLNRIGCEYTMYRFGVLTIGRFK